MKRIVAALLVCALMVSLVACNGAPQSLSVPDLIGVDEQTAKTVLTNNGLIPAVQYEYNDDTDAGLVIRTEPAFGNPVAKNDKIVIYVSKGVSYLMSKNATIGAGDISPNGDHDRWDFFAPYIKEGVLYIECVVKYGVPMSWDASAGEKEGYGEASINDTFDKIIPFKFTIEKVKFKANEEQNITLMIPLNDLNVQKPTSMHVKLMGFVDGAQKAITAGFTMSW